jgi:putative Holliday junction resolvase
MIEIKGRILSVDPGDKRIGLAVSDPTQTIASALQVILHTSRAVDAAQIAQIAQDQSACLIVIGQALDADGQVGPAARKALRMAEAIRLQTDIPIVLWDESSSTETARQIRFEMGGRRRQRSGHLDDLAAVVILQSYLDAHYVADAPEDE